MKTARKANSSPETEVELLSAINSKLSDILAFLATAGKEQDEQIQLLRDLGYDWARIGTVVGLSPDAARMRNKKAKKPNNAK